jgi:hypothetical protein
MVTDVYPKRCDVMVTAAMMHVLDEWCGIAKAPRNPLSTIDSKYCKKSFIKMGDR